jgi:hypothetical protein
LTFERSESIEEAIRSIIEENVPGPTTKNGDLAISGLVRRMATRARDAGYRAPVEDRRTRTALEALNRQLPRVVRRYGVTRLIEDGVDERSVFEIAQGLCPMPPFCRDPEGSDEK